jgi:hypothetical protein
VDVTASVFPDRKFTGKITFIIYSKEADESLNFQVKSSTNENNNKAVLCTIQQILRSNQKTELKLLQETYWCKWQSSSCSRKRKSET